MYALDLRSCFQCATTQVALPSGVRGPELSLPCSRHLVLPEIGCFWQSPPDLVLAEPAGSSFGEAELGIVLFGIVCFGHGPCICFWPVSVTLGVCKR